MLSVSSKSSVEEAKQQWRANWETTEAILDYKEIPSVIEWNETFDLVEGKLFDGFSFPLALQPKEKGLPLEFTLEHLKHSHEWLDKVLMKHGAVLFRGFPIKSPSDFDVFVKSCGYENSPYTGGATRHHIVGDVLTTNDAPPKEVIAFHHEMAFLPTHPKHVFFYCEVAAQSGGETPIVLSWLVYEKCVEKMPDFIRELEEKGVKYPRYLSEEDDPTSAIGRGWKSTYSTSDKAEVERKCVQTGFTFEWLENNALRTCTPILPAIRLDKRTGKKVFFNVLGTAFSVSKKEKLAEFGDGSPIPTEQMEKILSIMDELKVAFKWVEGDILAIDNKLAMHSRNFFIPPRKVYASFTR